MLSTPAPAPPDEGARAPASDAAAAAAASPLAVPRDSSPTWELEMLVSGGVLYSLFQLPAQLERLFLHWQTNATLDATVALLMGYAYLKGALYTLIAAFVIHLGVRAYWVGLVGLNSVFPAGIRWERMTIGPVTREIYRARMPTLPSTIARLDNFASIIFSFAFLVVMMTLLSIPIAAVAGGIAYGVSHLAFGGGHVRELFYGMGLLLVVPIGVALFDLKYAARLDPAGAGMRRLRRLAGALYAPQFAGLMGPTLYTISTNGRKKTTYALFYMVFLGSFLVVMAEVLVARRVLGVNGAAYFSTRSDANSVGFAHYESAWTDGTLNDAAPSIQSDVVTAPFVRLFIPYQPARHNPGIPATCPGVAPLARSGLHLTPASGAPPQADSLSAAVLRCLTTMHAVRMDSSTVPGLRFRFATHPRTGVNGIVAYLPTRALAPGEHVITVMPPPRRAGSKSRRPLEPWVIPFWL